MIAKRLWTYLAVICSVILGINQFATELFGEKSPVHLGPDLQKWLAFAVLFAMSYRQLKDDNHNGIPDLFEGAAWVPPTEAAKEEAKEEQIAKTVAK